MIFVKRPVKNLFFFIFVFIFLLPFFAKSQDSLKDYNRVPLTRLFYNIDNNLVGSITRYYGINYVVGGLATYALVEGNVDWGWYRYTQVNKSIYYSGFASVDVGGYLPVVAPLFLYFYGSAKQNSDLQVTGLALGQAAILGLGISSFMKAFTGRLPPTQIPYTDDFLGDFRFGFLRGGVDNGWPSSHTTTAFAMATTLIELYPDNTSVKTCSLTYAALIGIGVSTNIHWLSDVVTGALIGYGIGKTVGFSFHKLMKNKKKPNAFKFSVTPLGAVFNYKL